MGFVNWAIWRPMDCLRTGFRGSWGLPILLYHRVLPQYDPLYVEEPDVKRFDRDMAMVSRVLKVLPLEEAIGHLLAGTLPPRAAAITFDDGYRDNLEYAVPILRKYRLPATFFVTTGFMQGGYMFNDMIVESIRSLPNGPIDLGWLNLGVREIGSWETRRLLIKELIQAVKYLDYDTRQEVCERIQSLGTQALIGNVMLSAEQIAALARLGMGIGGHTVSHPILAKLPLHEAAYQIQQNRSDLANILGQAPRLFAFPNGRSGLDYTEAHVHLAKEAGYSAALSVGGKIAWTKQLDQFQIPRISSQAQSPLRLVSRMLYHSAWWKQPVS